MRNFNTLRNLTNTLILVLFVCMLSIPSCKTDTQSYQQRLVNTGQPAIHAVHNERLEAIMKKLDTPTFNRMPQELETSADQDVYFEQVGQVAQSMAEAAEAIPGVADKLSLDVMQKKLFLSLSEKLQQQAGELQKIAPNKNIDEISDSMEAIASTCNACHSAFRIMPENEK